MRKLSIGIGMGGADLIYGTLALARQKFGEPDKATADLKKGEALHATLPAQSDNTIGLEYFAEYQTMLAIAQGDLDKASNDVKAISLTGPGRVSGKPVNRAPVPEFMSGRPTPRAPVAVDDHWFEQAPLLHGLAG
jgi:hypothetical protein